MESHSNNQPPLLNLPLEMMVLISAFLNIHVLYKLSLTSKLFADYIDGIDLFASHLHARYDVEVKAARFLLDELSTNNTFGSKQKEVFSIAAEKIHSAKFDIAGPYLVVKDLYSKTKKLTTAMSGAFVCGLIGQDYRNGSVRKVYPYVNVLQLNNHYIFGDGINKCPSYKDFGKKVLRRDLPLHHSMLPVNFKLSSNDAPLANYSFWRMFYDFELPTPAQFVVEKARINKKKEIEREKNEKEAEIKKIRESQNNLLAWINELTKYGQRLCAEGAIQKGQVAIDLAKEATELANQYFRPNTKTYQEFQKEFLTLIHSKDAEMAEYRANWKTILINIAISLSVVGAVVLGVCLAVTKMTEGRALFFFSDRFTTGERKITEIDLAARNVKAIS